jgi:hypothetical protein
VSVADAPRTRLRNWNGVGRLNAAAATWVSLGSRETRRIAMRIAQIAPLAESVPPRLYGGTERVVAWLTEELVALGHDVTLFASGDSKTSAKLVPILPRALRLGRPRSDPMAAQAALLEIVAQHAASFDLIHSHIDWLHLPLLSRLGVPFITTPHGRLDLPGLPDLIGRFPNAPFVSISNNQRGPLTQVNWLGTVHHGLPIDALRPNFESGTYLAFLGRLTPEKGQKLQYGWRGHQGFLCVSQRKSHEANNAISRSICNQQSTAISLNWSERSTTVPSKISLPTPRPCCFRSVGQSRLVSS